MLRHGLIRRDSGHRPSSLAREEDKRAWKSFRCEGLTFNPSYALSDSSGRVSVAVQLGSIPGSQVLAETPKSGGGTGTVTSREIALGYQEKLGKEVSEKYCTVCHDPESTPERASNFDNLAPPAPHQFTDGDTLNQINARN